jgi:deoxyhypusine synthase
MQLSEFLEKHFKHFNARETLAAAKAYKSHVESGNLMMVTLAGAMSTAELGIILAEMIRQDKVHAITCTGANLEESLYNLVAYDHYKVIPNYRDLTPEEEEELLNQHLNRVTDTCIPEDAAIRLIEGHLFEEWKKLNDAGSSAFPHQITYNVIRSGKLKPQSDPKDSWLVAACEKNLPIYVPGWEDSTCGNIFASYCMTGELSPKCIKGGIEYMMDLASWYQKVTKDKTVGFFQVGGGIAGDFPICVVPMLHQDMGMSGVPLWGYFCQIGDSTTSYGSYSGAVPNEKITWGKLSRETPKFMIESDATIVAPLIWGYILEY